MNITWLTINNTNVEPVISSLHGHNISVRHIDRQWAHHNEPAPDLILYNGVAGGPHLRPPRAFKSLREKCPVIMLCFDGSCPDWHPLLETYQKEECFDRIVNIDGNTKWPSGVNDLTLLCPIDPSYYDKVVNKDIECGFAGGSQASPRKEFLEELGQLVTIKPRSEKLGTYQEYADFMMRCKVVVNMSLCGSRKARQVKARVIEAGLAGACLLEEKSELTDDYFTYFTPDIEYIWYEGARDCREKIKWLMENPKIVEMVGSHLLDKVRTEHSPEIFWSKVLKIPRLQS